jgi:restriction system protein
MPMTKPGRCQCRGCSRCSPERGRCDRPPGDYPDEYYCEDCHRETARVMFDAQPQTNKSGMDTVLEAWSHRFTLQWNVVGDVRVPRPRVDADVTFQPGTGSLSIEGQQPSVGGSPVQQPEFLIPASIVVFGDSVAEGQLVEAVAIPWTQILEEFEKDPQFLHKLEWRKVEELVAAAYKREGWPEVILTPRSGDRGRDIIASKPGIGAIRIYDQVKAYKPGHRVTADEVRAVLGVLSRDQNVSKGIVTTTATFAPGIRKELEAVIPYRLELKDGPALAKWLTELRETRPPTA